LILGERLGRKEVERPCRPIRQEGVEHRQIVAQRLATGRGGDDDHVFATQRSLYRPRLVGVELLDRALAKRCHQAGVDPGRKPGVLRWPGRQMPPVGDAMRQLTVVFNLLEDGLQTHGCDYNRKRSREQTRKPKKGPGESQPLDRFLSLLPLPPPRKAGQQKYVVEQGG
jgi:hypothetical protein